MLEDGPAPGEPPYQGLHYFDETDAPPNTVTYSPDGTRLGHRQFRRDGNHPGRRDGSAIAAVGGPHGMGDQRRLQSGQPPPHHASADRTARIWDITPDRELLTLFSGTTAVNRLAYSPDGTRLATGNDDGTTQVWDAASGANLLTLYGTPAAFKV